MQSYPFLGLTALNVRRQVNLLGQLCDVDLEAILDLVQDFGVGLVRHESNGQTFGAETAGTCNSVQVSVRVLWHVIVEDNVHSLNVHATAEQVGGDQDPLKRSTHSKN